MFSFFNQKKKKQATELINELFSNEKNELDKYLRLYLNGTIAMFELTKEEKKAMRPLETKKADAKLADVDFEIPLETKKAAAKLAAVNFYDEYFGKFKLYFIPRIIRLVTNKLIKAVKSKDYGTSLCNLTIEQLQDINKNLCAKYRVFDGIFTAFYTNYRQMIEDNDPANKKDHEVALNSTIYATSLVVSDGYFSVEREHFLVKGNTAKNIEERLILNDCYFNTSSGKPSTTDEIEAYNNMPDKDGQYNVCRPFYSMKSGKKRTKKCNTRSKKKTRLRTKR